MERADPGEYTLLFGPFRRCKLENIAQSRAGLEHLVDLIDRDARRRFLFDETRAVLTEFLQQDRFRQVLPQVRDSARQKRVARNERFKADLFGPEHPAFEYGL